MKTQNGGKLALGHIAIKTDATGQPTVNVEFADGTVWLTVHQMAQLLDVFVSAVTSNLRVIFKNRILREEDVSFNYKYEHEGRQRETIYYNLETLIAICYRVNSRNAKAIRKWIAATISGQYKVGTKSSITILMSFNIKAKDTC